MTAKELPAAISQWTGEIREYEGQTGTEVEEYWTVVTLKKMLPGNVRTMLQTMNYVTNREWHHRQLVARQQLK